MSKEQFIEYKVKEHHEYIPYFRNMEIYNVEGAPFIGSVPDPKALRPEEFKDQIDQGALVLDTRSPISFGGAFIQSSYSIPVDILSFAGWVIPYDKPFLVIAEDNTMLEYTITSLIRIGYDNIEGYLRKGLESWVRSGYPLEYVDLMTVSELKEKLDDGEEIKLLDVRSKEEYEEGHIKGVQNIYVGHLEEHLKDVPQDQPMVVICGVGTRASLGASILLRKGRRDIHNLLGGMTAWEEAGYPTVE
jgi:hydroxyacylglutathione hydrolase